MKGEGEDGGLEQASTAAAEDERPTEQWSRQETGREGRGPHSEKGPRSSAADLSLYSLTLSHLSPSSASVCLCLALLPALCRLAGRWKSRGRSGKLSDEEEREAGQHQKEIKRATEWAEGKAEADESQHSAAVHRGHSFQVHPDGTACPYLSSAVAAFVRSPHLTLARSTAAAASLTRRAKLAKRLTASSSPLELPLHPTVSAPTQPVLAAQADIVHNSHPPLSHRCLRSHAANRGHFVCTSRRKLHVPSSQRKLLGRRAVRGRRRWRLQAAASAANEQRKAAAVWSRMMSCCCERWQFVLSGPNCRSWEQWPTRKAARESYFAPNICFSFRSLRSESLSTSTSHPSPVAASSIQCCRCFSLGQLVSPIAVVPLSHPVSLQPPPPPSLVLLLLCCVPPARSLFFTRLVLPPASGDVGQAQWGWWCEGEWWRGAEQAGRAEGRRTVGRGRRGRGVPLRRGGHRAAAEAEAVGYKVRSPQPHHLPRRRPPPAPAVRLMRPCSLPLSPIHLRVSVRHFAQCRVSALAAMKMVDISALTRRTARRQRSRCPPQQALREGVRSPPILTLPAVSCAGMVRCGAMWCVSVV